MVSFGIGSRGASFNVVRLLFIVLLVAISISPAIGQAQVFINEIRIDQPSDDEYFELTGSPGQTLDGLTYLVIGEGTGGSGVIEAVVDLTGQTIPVSGFFVAAESSFTLALADLTTSLNFENGDNVTHLLVEGFTGSNGDDLDTNDDGVLDVIPWTFVIDSVALIQAVGGGDLVYSTTTVGLDGSFVPGHVFRNPDGTGAFQIGGFTLGTNDTPGESNQVVVEPLDLAIHEIQGVGHNSPFDGELVKTTGIVTAVDSNGFYLQDPLGDDNENTSDGIFVFTGSAPSVSMGDELEVEGIVDEFIPGGASTNNLSTTEIVSPIVLVLSTGNPLPPPVVLGRGGRVPPNQIIDNDIFGIFDPNEDGIDFYESVEGLRVTVKNAMAVSPTNGFGEIFSVGDRGRDATQLSRRKTINIGPDDFNPERVQIQFDSGILPGFTENVNVGDRLGDVIGVVSYNFGNYEVLLTHPFATTSAGLKPETTNLKPRPLKLTVASFNVLNLDPKVEDINLVADNDPDEIDDDVGNGRFQALAVIIVNNLKTPDIIALQEVQDNNGAEITGVTAADDTLQLLVDEIASIGNVAYSFIDNPFIGNETSGGQPGGNIRTAFLYNPNRVSFIAGSLQTVTDPADQQTNPDNPFFQTRLPLVAKFEFRNEEITVINNHFSSKGGSSPLFGQIQPSVELQEDSTVNGGVDFRRAQAETVKSFVNNIFADDPFANIIVLGDFNEFEFISPLDILEQSLSNLTKTLPENERYSFIFDGNSQSLDHILVSDKLFKNAKFDIVHVNSEFADTPQKASDHDPLLTRLKLKKDGGDEDDDD